MLRTLVRLSVIVVALFSLSPDASARGFRCGGCWGGWGCGGGLGYAGWCYGGLGYGCGYGGCGYGGGWGYRGWGYGLGGGYPGGWGYYGAVMPVSPRRAIGLQTGLAARANLSPVSAPSNSETARNSARLGLRVPADAEVIVNGMATKSTGAYREFISHDLEPGSQYNYHFQVRFVRDGQPVELEKSIVLAANQSRTLAFDESDQASAGEDNRPQTTLIVHVPAEAQLYLADRKTGGKGPVRQFSSVRLAAGEQWKDYCVRAELERNGRTETREMNISLTAGETRELTLEFEAAPYAVAAQKK